LEAAIDIAARGHQAHQALSEPLPFHVEVHLLYHCEALAITGRFEAAAALAASGYHQALATNDAEAQALMALQRSRIAIGRGHLSSAVAHAREALGIFLALGCDRWAGGARIFLATAQALAGDAASARAALNPTDEPELESMPFSSATDLKLARAWTAVASGQLAAGREIAERAAVRAHEVGDVIGESQAWHTCARLGGPGQAAAALERLTIVIEGELIAGQACHARALTGRDAEALEDVASSFARMGAELLAAEAAADAAVCWQRNGDPRRARSAERLAGILASRCHGARTPALTAVRARAALTPAERDAAVLAAERRSNRYIAQALSLSVRTVENQLQRVYAKLGVSHRADLAQALREDLGDAVDSKDHAAQNLTAL
jgi:DNA-binding CsgD family transcriptional regulator